MDDKSYATPQDNYFGFLSKRKQGTFNDEVKEAEILSELGLETVLPPYFNVQTGRFEI